MPPKKGYRQTPEDRAKKREAALRRFADPAERERMSEVMRRNWQNPAYREATIAARRARPVKTDEEREAHRQAYYRRNADTIKTRARKWYTDNLEVARARGREYARAHAVEARARYDAWIADPENRARVNAWNRRYAKANPAARQRLQARRRARLLGQFVEDVDRAVVLANYSGLCGWCADPVDPADFHVDHIVALVRGGEHSYANTQPVHPACNYEKRTVLKERAA